VDRDECDLVVPEAVPHGCHGGCHDLAAPLVALQIPYNLVERTVERDLIPMAETMGLGVVPWSPLAGGVLTGKYHRADLESAAGAGSGEFTRKDQAVGNGFLTARGLDIADTVRGVATELATTPSRVALAWTLRNPAVVASLVGARTGAQLEDDLGALQLELDPDHLSTLDEASAVDLGFPYETLRRLGLTTARPKSHTGGTGH
jgi:aryl-alcohol dehydrogenase-like predicted oxidoreductase